ncbi:hypothetical protein F5B17DRAFT_331740 [Nemania serpens]|nr:hypothetical protein F5B17DRAFT_331740 [Nemania serpens]
MQRLASPSIIPKLPVNTRLWQCQTRHARKKAEPRAGPPRQGWPTFEISNLLLDLDAFEAKGVRPFDSKIDGVLEPHPRSAQRERELEPTKKRVAEFEKAYEEASSNFNSIAASKFHPLHINECDILAAALLDAPNIPNLTVGSKSDPNSRASHADILDSVLHQNGIPSVARNSTSNTIAYMLRRRQLASRPLSRPDDDEELIRQALRECTTFSTIDRLVARVARDPISCQTLLRISDELHTSLAQVPEAEPLQLLSLLNNLVINLDRYELDLPPKLQELGIWASLKCQAIVTAQHYIKRRLEHGSCDHDFINSIFDNLLRASIASSPFTSYEFQLDPSGRLTAVFSLLTGYVPGGNQPAVSLRSLVNRERPDSFRLYIQCLSRLGAFRTIWHEWHSTNPSGSVSAGARQDLAAADNDFFVTAMLDALAKNHRIGELAESPSFTNVSGQFQEDCQLDMLAISRSANILALPEKTGIEEFTSTPGYAEIREQLYQIFEEKQIEEAFAALQKFLILTTSSS